MVELHQANPNAAEGAENCSRAAPPGNAGYSRSDSIIYTTLISLACAALYVAPRLQPAPRGAGTHEQLGLPPCPFLHLTGIPCPSCGLTTSFAHAARLHFYDALITQPFGLIVFCLTVFIIPLSIYLIHRRIPWSKLIYWQKANPAFYTMIAIYLLSWLYKIAAMR